MQNILQKKNYILFFTASFISSIMFMFINLFIGLSVSYSDSGYINFNVYSIILVLIYILLYNFFGALVDRLDKVKVLFYTYISIAVTYLLIIIIINTLDFSDNIKSLLVNSNYTLNLIFNNLSLIASVTLLKYIVDSKRIVMIFSLLNIIQLLVQLIFFVFFLNNNLFFLKQIFNSFSQYAFVVVILVPGVLFRLIKVNTKEKSNNKLSFKHIVDDIYNSWKYLLTNKSILLRFIIIMTFYIIIYSLYMDSFMKDFIFSFFDYNVDNWILNNVDPILLLIKIIVLILISIKLKTVKLYTFTRNSITIFTVLTCIIYLKVYMMIKIPFFDYILIFLSIPYMFAYAIVGVICFVSMYSLLLVNVDKKYIARSVQIIPSFMLISICINHLLLKVNFHKFLFLDYRVFFLLIIIVLNVWLVLDKKLKNIQ